MQCFAHGQALLLLLFMIWAFEGWRESQFESSANPRELIFTESAGTFGSRSKRDATNLLVFINRATQVSYFFKHILSNGFRLDWISLQWRRIFEETPRISRGKCVENNNRFRVSTSLNLSGFNKPQDTFWVLVSKMTEILMNFSACHRAMIHLGLRANYTIFDYSWFYLQFPVVQIMINKVTINHRRQ